MARHPEAKGPLRVRTERYVSTGLLGQGGMAEVYRAWDQREKIWCAVKVLHEKYSQKPAARQRFVDEGRTVISLDHRNVIDAWDLEERVERPFLVMEIAEGGSLKDWVDRHGKMPARMAVDVAMQISKGIGAAHRVRVVHRDVKPHNILLTRRGVCKVTDFGIAKIFRPDGSTDVPDATLQSQTAMGTLGYMAPEQRTDLHLADVRADVYGIGATLFTLLTGTVVSNLFAVEREPQLLQGVAEPLVPVLMRATAYRPEQRYETVQELARALFEVRERLPPDDPDAPPLVGSLPPEPPKPELGPARSSTPCATPLARPRRRSETPAMPRTARPSARLEVPPPTAPARARTRPVVVVTTLLGILLGILTLDLMWVSHHARVAAGSSLRLAQRSQRDIWLIDTLATGEEDRTDLEGRFRTLWDTRHVPDQNLLIGRDLVQALRRRAHGRPQDARQARVLSTVSQLEAGVGQLDEAIASWAYATDHPCIAVCLGLAPDVSVVPRHTEAEHDRG